MEVAGIDVGYFSTKAVSEDKNTLVPSIVGSPDVSLLTTDSMSEGEAVVTIPSGTYLVGQDAIQKSRMVDRREGRDWVNTNAWEVLFYYSLSQIASSDEIMVVTGLPASYFALDHVQMKKAIDGKHKFQVNQEKFEFKLSSIVTMQPFGTMCNAVLDYDGGFVDSSLATATVGVIDIGGKTTNILTVERMSDIEARTMSVDKGGWDVIRAAKVSLGRKFRDFELRDHQVAQVVASKTIKRFGEDKDVSEIVEPAIESMTQDVVSLTTQVWGNGSGLDKILITGGGSLLVGKEIASEFPHAEIMENPVNSNAEGYYKYGKFIQTLE